jgi:hypothetical protein
LTTPWAFSVLRGIAPIHPVCVNHIRRFVIPRPWAYGWNQSVSPLQAKFPGIGSQEGPASGG